MESGTNYYSYQMLHKVGGSHLTHKAAFAKVSALFDTSKPQAIIISALGKTTANLQKVLDIAKNGGPYQATFDEIVTFHQQLAAELLTEPAIFNRYIENDLVDIGALLLTIAQSRSYSIFQQDQILSLGEFWSNFIFGQFWSEDYHLLDASKIIVIEKIARKNVVDWQKTEQNLNQYLQHVKAKHLLITGYIAQDKQGNIATLGFEGSDLSAAIFTYLLKAASVTFWSDVDGIFSADPDLVPQAKIIPELSYQEAKELAYLGASILHPQTIRPLMEIKVPIFIRNAYQSSTQYTVIKENAKASGLAVSGISLKQAISLINIESRGTLDASMLEIQALSALKAANIPVLLNTQSSASHSICLAVEKADLADASDILIHHFDVELKQKALHGITAKPDCAMLSIVGDAMVGKVGCCAQILKCLAKANINLLALSQGSSERNISIVVDGAQSVKAINVVHAGAYLSTRQMYIGLIGPGNVGKVFLKQLLNNRKRLEKTLGISFHIKAIASSKKMIFIEDLDNADTAKELLAISSDAFELDAFMARIHPKDLTHAVIIDCTASEEISGQYQKMIEQGFHLITPNKKVTSGPDSRFEGVKKVCKQHMRYFLYETNVCAGLPVIKTLQDLIATGDVIENIQGVFSGTLSYLFNEMGRGKSFSKALLAAYDKGLTEPDPRDDLNGLDVARKCVCLAREMGSNLELSDVEIAPILPSKLMDGTLAEFWSRTQAMDEVFNTKLKVLKDANKKLVYCGQINKQGQVSLCMKEIDDSDPFFHLKGTDNMVVYQSKRYNENPLVIQGPGAGASVTAGGVFADLLRLVSLTSGE